MAHKTPDPEARDRYGWRQDCPVDQLTVIRMAIEGHVDNLRDIHFASDAERFYRAHNALDNLFAQLEDLEAYLRKGSW